MALRECPSCKVKLDPAYMFCPDCGAQIPPAAAAPSPAPEPAPAPAPAPVVEAPAADFADDPATRDGSASAPVEAPAAPLADVRLRLVRLARGGGQATEYDIPACGMVIGRTTGDLTFPDDDTISPKHAQLRPVGQEAELTDLGSVNGIYARIKGDRVLEDGDRFLCGDSCFRISLLPGTFVEKDYRRFSAPQEPVVRGSVVRILANGSDGEIYAIRALPFVLGREEGDIRCGSDRFMSRRHAAVVDNARGLALQDQKSRNGTFVRADGKVVLGNGDVFMVGRQLFRFEAVAP